MGNESFNQRLELQTEQLVSFVHDEHFALAEVADPFVGQVEDPPRSPY